MLSPHNKAVIARLARATQYSRGARDQSRSRGVLDHPLSRMMTMEKWRERTMNYRFNFQTAGHREQLLPSPREAVGRGRGWGVPQQTRCQRSSR
jgi:hypothetical protein